MTRSLGGIGLLGGGAVSTVEAGKTASGQILGFLVHVHKAGDSFTGVLHFLAGNVRDGEARLDNLLGTEMLTVNLLEGEDTSPLLLGGDTGSLDRDRGGSLTGVVESGGVGGSR